MSSLLTLAVFEVFNSYMHLLVTILKGPGHFHKFPLNSTN